MTTLLLIATIASQVLVLRKLRAVKEDTHWCQSSVASYVADNMRLTRKLLGHLDPQDPDGES